LSSYAAHCSRRCGLHSFLLSVPTRRSSDLLAAVEGVREALKRAADVVLAAAGLWLGIWGPICSWAPPRRALWAARPRQERWWPSDRKSTRLNSSHVKISYAVFCLKKKKR